jgi:hypothetical protein
VSLADHIGTYRPLMDLPIGEDMHTRDQRHDGVDHLAKQLERLAEGITDGSSHLPACASAVSQAAQKG